ncbi:lauroyl acyltransferase [Pseudooceanicola sediminis]|uniref:Lauroyl acyltransferase n=1 Tax=Pseudooceanicola sediminis TaxID=2211117 RepID=A0A399IVD7_9RHOB|nr:lysophospholipid acyltransferase family protein [Pseudooceanicola sediminis]KAA2312692.1 lysophospholipid acyltransferase family protein [Puniceibacterium sp. HSS470]RII37093.1 lauroyl acyltransferase [Pseudooceanicola sediminis]|tara:strand:- start:18417 stop:19316 length:900 start_codon:yes stop_codon:yes gene_type:complete
MTPSDLPLRQRVTQYIVNLVLGGLVGLALALPYATRVRLMGWVVSRMVAPVAYRGRVRDNLTHIWPEIPRAQIREMERAVPDNAGRTLIEIYSGAEFKAHLGEGTLEGPGLAALDAAHAVGRPVVLVSGHFGNYDAFRAAVAMRYGNVGALYRPLNNLYFNRHYVRAMESIATPMFARGRRGLAEMVRYLRQGNIIAMLSDQHFGQGAALSFFGQPAFTATSAAEMALKYDALMIPIYGIRQPDGLSFRVVVEEPLAPSTPPEMSQALNDSLEAMTRKYPDQWFWIHRRWKPGSDDKST